MVDVIIDQVSDGRAQWRSINRVVGLMVHRCGVNSRTGAVIGYDAPAICDAFTGRAPRWRDVAKATNGQNPYTFYIGGNLGPAELDGKVWQALPLDEIGHHALGCSADHIGIALIGDFRVGPASDRQWSAAVDLCADLCLMLSLPPRHVVGHGEMTQAHKGIKAPGQPGACPGDLLVMDAFRERIHDEMRARARADAIWRLEQVNVRLL